MTSHNEEKDELAECANFEGVSDNVLNNDAYMYMYMFRNMAQHLIRRLS